MKPNGTSVPSEYRSMWVPSPEAVGNPAISSTRQESLPILTWQNNCNIKFRVWFGNDPGFMPRTTVFFQTKNPELNRGIFTKQLTYGQWLGIRRLVGDQAGSKIYWYVESFDGLNRMTSTEVQSFILEE